MPIESLFDQLLGASDHIRACMYVCVLVCAYVCLCVSVSLCVRMCMWCSSDARFPTPSVDVLLQLVKCVGSNLLLAFEVLLASEADVWLAVTSTVKPVTPALCLCSLHSHTCISLCSSTRSAL